MRARPFGLGERKGCRRERCQRLGRARDERRALDEVGDAQAAREARGARRRQHVVGAGDVIADRFGRVAAEEDRAGVADAPRPRLGQRHLQRQLGMLDGEAVDILVGVAVALEELAELGFEGERAAWRARLGRV